MIRRLFYEQAGYSLVEVMASIMILTIAIIPMVSMFDAGLETSNTAANYDKARSLARKQLEAIQSLPYSVVKTNLPNAPCSFDGSGLCASAVLVDSSSEFSAFRYRVDKQYVEPNAGETAFVNVSDDRGMMRVTVTVGWGGGAYDDREISIMALKAR